MIELYVDIIDVENSFFRHRTLLKKNSGQEIKIGKYRENEIVVPLASASKKHGALLFKEEVFSGKIIYTDYSKFGTTIIHWDIVKGASEFVIGGENGKQIELKSGDWITILNTVPGGQSTHGVIIIPRLF